MARCLFFLLTAVLVMAAAPAPDQQPGAGAGDQLESRAAAAAEKVSRQDYSGALADYNAILRLRPNSPEARANAGMMRHLLGDTGGAVADFECALRLNPALEAVTLMCGLDLLRLHRPAEALAYLRRAIQMNPRDNRAARGLGEALFSLGRLEEAITNYRTSIQLDPSDTDAAYGAGITYLSIMKDALERLSGLAHDSVYSRILVAEAKGTQNRWKEAAQILSEIADSGDSRLTCVSASLGFARLHAGETAKAETEFRKERPGDVCPLSALGLSRVAFERGDLPAALSTLERAWLNDPSVIQANAGLLWSGLDDASVARIRRSLQNTATAVNPGLLTLLRASLDDSERGTSESAMVHVRVDSPRDTADPESLLSSGKYSACAAILRPLLSSLGSKRSLLLAQAAYYSGDAETSLKAAERVLKTAPAEPAAWFWKAKAAQRLALEAFAAMQRSAPDSPHLHFLIAETYREQDNPDAARQEYARVLAMSPDDLPAQIGLARVLIALNDSNATGILNQVLSRDAKNPEASYLLGNLLVSQVRYSEARPLLNTALAGDESYVVRAHSLLAHIAYEDENWSEALREMQPCLKHDKDGGYHYRVYQIYKKLGDAPAAAEALRTVKLLRQRRQLSDE